MRPYLKLGTAAAGAAVIVLLATCGGGGTGASGDRTEIDLAAVERGIDEMSSVITVCRTGGSIRLRGDRGDPLRERAVWLVRLLERNRAAALRGNGNRPAFFDPAKPSDTFGDCGGRITFPSYSHSSGTTTGVVAFEDFCSVDAQTGEHSIVDGNLNFVDRGTPGSSGPVTNRIELESSNGLTFTTETASGSELTSQRLSFTDFVYTPGVPGGSPTASNPDRTTLEDARISDLQTGKTYRQSDYSVSSFTTTSGGTQTTFSGRGHRSNGDFFDISTTSPLLTDANGNILSGQLTFTGANNSNAVLTLVPGPTLQGTMTVNGTQVTNVPACQ